MRARALANPLLALALALTTTSRVLRAEDAPLENDDYGATATVEAPRHEPTRRTLEGDELVTIPGTRGDALRAIEVLPGVGRTSMSWGAPILRGAGPDESQVFIADVPVPMLFHFGGVTSVFASRLLDRVDVYPSNFSARFGRATGGVIDAHVRELRPDRLHGVAEVSVVDSSVLAMAPLGSRAGVALGARRSNLDFVFEKLVPDGTYSVVAAPVYYDYQAVTDVRVDDRSHLRVLVFGGHDSLRLLFSQPSRLDPGLSGRLEADVAFQRVQARLDTKVARGLSQSVSLTYGRSAMGQVIASTSQQFTAHELYARATWSAHPSSRGSIEGGLDLAGQLLDGSYDGPRPTAGEGAPYGDDPLVTQRRARLAGQVGTSSPAVFVESVLEPWDGTRIVPGLRVDFFSQLRRASVNPRVSSRVEVAAGTVLLGGLGLYAQAPDYWKALPGLGNPTLAPQRAVHATLGVERRWASGVEAGVAGFYKHLYDRVVETSDRAPPYFVNAGVGRVYGAELSLRAKPDSRTSVFVAYTLSRSERRDRSDPWRPYDHDQPHMLSIAASRALGRGWEVGARFRLVSGDPLTPVVGSVFDGTTGVYRPVYGGIDSARNPTFHQLDVRVEKRWQLGVVTLATYLEVLNAYDAKNAEGLRYSYDYARSEPVVGMPILPNLGVRGEL